MIEKKELKKILEKLPKSPGIYKMFDKDEKVIYIGKAKDLSKRVKQYFKEGYQHSYRTKKLMEKMVEVKWIATDTELEAGILELNSIKQYKPKYNIIMKDDKNFVYIKITKEDFPRIQIVRQIKKDGAKYLGPKSAAHKIKDTFKLIKKIFPFRHCSLDIVMQENDKVKVTKRTIKFPCLDYYIKRCIAPCIGKCTKEEYAKIVEGVERFLEGKGEHIMKILNEQMMYYAGLKQFEKAGKIRDKLEKVKDILEKQRVAGPNQENRDIINYCIAHGQAYFNLFQVRDGKLIGQENFILKAEELDEEEQEEVLEAFLKQYYELATDIPKEILIPHQVLHQKELAAMMGEQLNKKVRIIIPVRGDKNKLLEMSLKNALIYADRNKPSWEKASELTIKAAEDLQKILKLPNTLKRIECYDISHLSGTETVGSMVVFEKGAPKKDMYRKFKMRTVENKPDDYKSMEEVLYRRLQKLAFTHKFKDYQFKKARKKDLEEIKKKCKKNKLQYSDKEEENNFYILIKDDSIAAFGQVEELSKKVSLLKSIYVYKKERGNKLGYKLMKELIKKAKSKRAYIGCYEEMAEYYLLFGFERIKKTPDELSPNGAIPKGKKAIALAFDKYKHQDDKSFSKIPDLIVIDGGKGQLACGEKVLKQLDLKIPYISLAKQQEEIFIPGQKLSIVLQRNNEALKLVQRARDEAHRFAITYNKKLRSNKFKRN